MVEAIVDESVTQAGLSDGSLTLLLLAVLLQLGGVFVFIFLALSGWHNEQSFTASVRTILVAVTGRAASALRGRVKAEKANELDKLVEELTQENEANAED